jgi:hypothetical protein
MADDQYTTVQIAHLPLLQHAGRVDAGGMLHARGQRHVYLSRPADLQSCS